MTQNDLQKQSPSSSLDRFVEEHAEEAEEFEYGEGHGEKEKRKAEEKG